MQLRTLALALSSLTFTLLSAQQGGDDDLVENGGFEEVVGKLRRPGSIEMAKGWKSPTANAADLYSGSLTDSPIGTRKNQRGDQHALSGENYAGLLWWSHMNRESRQYLQTKLKTPMKKGQKYCISYYVSLGDLSRYSADQFGVYVSKIGVSKKDEASLTYDPQVPAVRTRLYEDMHGWEGVCGVYEAKGDEQFLIIGNFTANEKNNTGKVKRPRGETRPQLNHAYYFIDDVSVVPVSSGALCKCAQLDETETEFIYSRKGLYDINKPVGPQVQNGVIYFKRYKAGVDQSQESSVASLAELLKRDTKVRVRLVGHIDAIEADRVRLRPDLGELGLERAESLKAALVEAGIAADRIATADRQGEVPADEAETEVGLSKNRRVQVELQ